MPQAGEAAVTHTCARHSSAVSGALQVRPLLCCCDSSFASCCHTTTTTLSHISQPHSKREATTQQRGSEAKPQQQSTRASAEIEIGPHSTPGELHSWQTSCMWGRQRVNVICVRRRQTPPCRCAWTAPHRSAAAALPAPAAAWGPPCRPCLPLPPPPQDVHNVECTVSVCGFHLYHADCLKKVCLLLDMSVLRGLQC